MRPAARLALGIALVATAGVARSDPPAVVAGCDRPLVVTLRHRDGTPVAGGAVTVFGPDAAKGAPFAFRSAATSDARGEAAFCVPREGTYAAYALAAGHRSGSAEVAIGCDGATLVLVLKEAAVGTLSVHVRGEGDAPLADANVRVEELDAGDREARPPSYDAISDVTGRVRFHVEGASGWKVTVRHPRHEPDELEVAGPGELVDLTLAMHLEPKPSAEATPPSKLEARRAARPLEGKPRRPDATDPSPDEPPPLEFPPLELPPIDAPPIELPPTEHAPTELPSIEVPPTEGPATGRPRTGAPPSEPLRPVRPMPLPKGAPPNPPTPPPTDRPAPPTDVPPAETPADFAGTWRHTGGTTITLTQSGVNVAGTWSHLDSTLAGVVRGRVLEFTTTSPRGLSTSGRVTLDASGRAFFGDGHVTGAGGGARFLFDAERPPLPGR